MVVRCEKVEAVNIRVFRWRESIMAEKFACSGLLLFRVNNETMEFDGRNEADDFLKISTSSADTFLNGMWTKLPEFLEEELSLGEYYYWVREFLSSFRNGGRKMLPETVECLEETISAFLRANFRLSEETMMGKSSFKIVVAVDVHMKSVFDKSVDFEVAFYCSPGKGGGLCEVLVVPGAGGGALEKKRRRREQGIVSPPPNICLVKEKASVIQDFLIPAGGGGDGDLKKIQKLSWIEKDTVVRTLAKFLKTWPKYLFREDIPVESAAVAAAAYKLEEIKPPLKMKKFADNGGCSKSSSSSSEEEDCCPICLQSFEEDDRVAEAPCSHMFHDDCLLRWLQAKVSCPMCRSHCCVLL